MYSTCLFCRSSLGANEVLEQFPVGRRVAFDPAKGRLWVVCPRCARWNLSPIEERWEVQEECERLFRGTRLRYSTDQIGLARVGDGLELVRIGDPLRPEMAAWRYGQIFGRRMRKQMTIGVGAAVVVGTVAALTPAGGLALGAVGIGGQLALQASNLYWHAIRPAARVPVGESAPVAMTRNQIMRARLKQEGSDWALQIDCRLDSGSLFPGTALTLTLSDENAVRAAAAILPRINPGLGRRSTVNTAVELLEQAGSAEACFRAASQMKSRWYGRGDGARISRLPGPIRLALEMAGHEELEREVLEGDLRSLELAWREAEEIASIADTLALPAGVQEKLDEWQNRAGAAEDGPA